MVCVCECVCVCICLLSLFRQTLTQHSLTDVGELDEVRADGLVEGVERNLYHGHDEELNDRDLANRITKGCV